MDILNLFITSRIAAIAVLVFLVALRAYAKQKNPDFYQKNHRTIKRIFWFLFAMFFVLGLLAPLITGCELLGARNSGGPNNVTCYYQGIVPDVWDKLVIYGSYALVAVVALGTLIARRMNKDR